MASFCEGESALFSKDAYSLVSIRRIGSRVKQLVKVKVPPKWPSGLHVIPLQVAPATLVASRL